MRYTKYIIEGFVEVIGLLPLTLILHALSSAPNLPIFNLPTLVTVKPYMIALIYLIYAIYGIIVVIAIVKLFDKSIKRSKALCIKAVGWVTALIVIIFIFNNQLFSNSEVIPEVCIWLIVVSAGNIIAYYKNKKRSNGK
jgi:hypothetical protein